ncbi:Rice salt sensitive [Thalictrum thalictroides]|uniref:Salt sensitive n=1 Tax=Thalictrum thalictroides TaxID=46969 RepID=A0A7J6WYR5_THATH|nr:Rice salt sensitive [Thalictrum thalictroides]
MLMWEDGFCQRRVADCLEDMDGEDPVRKAFSKMSIQLYNYGEGLMGKVASDKCHKWVFKEPPESETNISNYWQSSFDALPSEWTDQFNSGIQTIAVIQAGHGLLQLGSCEIIPEDLHFVLRMRHTFETLAHQSGFYLSQLFSGNRNTSSSISTPSRHTSVTSHTPTPIFNWNQSPVPFATNVGSHNYQNTPLHGLSLNKNETHPFLLPHSSDAQMEDRIGDHDSDIKWPNGLSFFNALTGQTDNSKLLFESPGLESKSSQTHQPVRVGSNVNLSMNLSGDANEPKNMMETSNSLFHHGNGNDNNTGNTTTIDYLSLDWHQNDIGNMEEKFKRSFTLPARMTTSSSSSSLDHHQHKNVDFRGSEAGIYSDIMDSFLE